MKKQIFYAITVLCLIGLVSAAGSNAEVGAQGQANLDTIKDIKHSQGLNAEIDLQVKGNVESKGMLSNGEFTLENGQTIRVKNEGNLTRFTIGNSSVNCSEGCNLTQIRVENKVKLQATLSNGRNAEIKIMPETASQTAINMLGLKSCDESNCSIELKEVGEGNSTKIAYEVKTKKEVKALGLFKSTVEIETQIDAETGEVIEINKPWWVSIKSE
jgi:hypothetical protein